MRNGFLLVAFCAVVMLTGCDKPEAKPAEKLAVQAKAQTVYGTAMERSRSTDCLMQMKGLQGLWAAEEFLPTAAKDLAGGGELLKCPGGGADYEFLVKGKVRNAGKVPVLRCPTHDLTLYSDGSASTGR